VGGAIALLALGPAVAFVNRAGQNRTGRVNISCAAKNALSLWSKSGAGNVTLALVGTVALQVTGVRAGQVTIRYSNRGILGSVVITVV
jgi:hypothetical protein